MSRPLLLLDVDGVLCPTFQEPLRPDLRLVEVDDGETIVADRGMTKRLRQLTGSFDLAWCTSWEERANRCIGPLYELPVLPTIRFGGAVGATWKLPAVRRFVGQRPFVWIDDELHQDAHEWAAERAVPTLLVDVDPRHGLTDAIVELILMFAADIASEA